MNLLKQEKKALKREYNQLRAKKFPQIQLSCHFELNPSHEAEHLHWGAYVDKDKSVFFRFATFSDVKVVTVEIKSSYTLDKQNMIIIPIPYKGVIGPYKNPLLKFLDLCSLEIIIHLWSELECISDISI